MALRFLRPGNRRRQVAQGLADARCRLRPSNMLGWSFIHFGAKISLARSAKASCSGRRSSRPGAGEIGAKLFADLGVGESDGAGMAFRRLVFPFLQQRPDLQRRRGDIVGRDLRVVEHRLEQRCPRPALARHQPDARLRHQAEAERRGLQRFAQVGDNGKQDAPLALRRFGFFVAAGQRQPGRRRRAELRRAGRRRTVRGRRNDRLRSAGDWRTGGCGSGRRWRTIRGSRPHSSRSSGVAISRPAEPSLKLAWTGEKPSAWAGICARHGRGTDGVGRLRVSFSFTVGP